MFMVVVFVVASWSWFSYVVFSISPTVGDFHEFSDGLRLLATKFFDVGFPSNTIAERVDCPVDGDILGSIQ
jgi:hypothetical protein